MFSYNPGNLPTLWWTAALLTGLAGSLHCIVMCGPLAMALPLGRLSRWQRPFGLLAYHSGRLTSYATLGAVVGWLGQGLWVVNLQAPVSITAGALLVIWGVSGKTQPSFGSWVSQRLGFGALMRQLLKHPQPISWFAMGALNGLLPCGLIYTALTGTLLSSTAGAGMSYMLFFGLGTLPALLGVRLLSTWLSHPLRRQFGRVLPVATVLVGVLLLVRGLQVYTPLLDRPTTPKPVPLCHG